MIKKWSGIPGPGRPFPDSRKFNDYGNGSKTDKIKYGIQHELLQLIVANTIFACRRGKIKLCLIRGGGTNE
ncbi:hypothetical protein ACJROX_22500 [Pseudalkalibacillus sp. A8]|uniref:hypothetical protein n=1 Tax=Pseudalkalibacillus sp. A8 TaxID=3382641 RepID=UPI0038B4D95B